MEDQKQKALNYAFFATLAMAGLTLLMGFLGAAQFTVLAIIEIVAFVVLGWFTKKGVKNASLGLIILFVLDRIAYFVNWLPHITTANTITFILWTVVLWQIFYKAYLYLKTATNIKRS